MSAPLPRGFQFAGVHSGVKANKADTSLVVSDRDAVAAARVTTNRARAWCVQRTERVLPSARVRAIIAVSGNANALSGEAGRAADEAMAQAAARALGVEPEQVVTASTGMIGVPLRAEVVASALPGAVVALGLRPLDAARAMMTTDRAPKVSRASLELPDGRKGTVLCLAKGSGMIHPNMATMLGFVVTDLPLTPAALDAALGHAVARSFHRISVDGDQSTNDMVVALANGAAGGPPMDADHPMFPRVLDVFTDVLAQGARAIAADGEGATRLLNVEVSGARDDETASHVARQVARSNLVKSAMFGADPGSWGRICAAAGQGLAELGAPGDTGRWRVRVQGTEVFRRGEPVTYDRAGLARRLEDEEVVIHLELGEGAGDARAWGCDLSYDYVKINADYAGSVTEQEGTVRLDAHLAAFSPAVKRSLLLESLRYIERFRGKRVVVKVAGALLEDPETTQRVAEDLDLLRAVGMQPIVLHGGADEVSRTLAASGRESDFVDGHRVTPPEDAELVEMVLLGRVNRRLVSRIQAVGGRAVGLSGRDTGLLQAAPLEEGEGASSLGRMGQVAAVDAALVETLLGDGYIPVIAPVGVAADGSTWNLDSDDAAAAVARRMGAFKLIYLLEVTGVTRDGARLSRLRPRQAQRMLREGEIGPRLVHVVEAAVAAVAAGVPGVHLVDGRVAHNLVSELFTDAGAGTMVELDGASDAATGAGTPAGKPAR